jgi:hypothetical protein
VTRCQGWYGFALNHDSTEAALSGLRDAAANNERPAGLGDLEISVTPGMQLTEDAVKRFEDMGVDRLILLQRGQDQAALLQEVEDVANNYIR